MRGVGCCSGRVVWCRLRGLGWASHPLGVLGWVSVGRAHGALASPSPSSGHPGVVASTFGWSALGVCGAGLGSPPERKKKERKKRAGGAGGASDQARRTVGKSRPPGPVAQGAPSLGCVPRGRLQARAVWAGWYRPPTLRLLQQCTCVEQTQTSETRSCLAWRPCAGSAR